MVKRYIDLYLDARRVLKEEYGEQSGNIARQLLSAASGKSAEAIIADRDIYASEEIEAKLNEYVIRALSGEPLAYILGEWSFMGLPISVTRDTLIPRDDTMAVTELAIQTLLRLPEEPRVLDLCTGTGCIGLAIAKRVKDAHVVMGDVSIDALRVAKKNTQNLHLNSQVTCIPIDVRKPATSFLGQYDLIVSNPPYVTDSEMNELDISVKNYEPELALKGGADGLDFYREIIKNYTTALRPGGYLCFEFGMGQENEVQRLLNENEYDVVTLKCDMRNVIRAVLARKK